MHIIVLVTVPRIKEARNIAETLVRKKLVACVNIIKGVESLFWWQGKVDKASELLLIIKSRKDKLLKIIKLVKSMHSYELPEIIAISVAGGEKKYMRWIDGSIR